MSKRKSPQIQEGDFRKVINKAFKENRHKEYLKKVLEDYKKYQQVFSDVFTDKNPLDAIYIFRANYLYVKHPVWREIATLGRHTFCDLAESIIEWMGWDNDHMHSFSIKKVSGEPQHPYTPFSIYAPGWEDDPHPTYKTNQVRIADVDYKKHPKWGFVFDFGAGHEFDIELKKIDQKVKVKDFGEPLPTCIDQRGVAPIQYPDYEENYEDEK